jgi:predicted enzyme related to lactoylglutathione lyase
MARAPAGRFRWVDLAASDAPRAIEFYTQLFGWSAQSQAANGGTLVRLAHRGCDVGSLYQLSATARNAGVSSHWTPYVRVSNAHAARERAQALGASVAIEEFDVDGIARIALIVDPVGAAIGLWEDLPS